MPPDPPRGKGPYGPFSGHSRLLHLQWSLITNVIETPATWDYFKCPVKKFPESHITNPLLTTLVKSRWLDTGLVPFFCEFTDLYSVSVHKHAKKKKRTWPIYPAILTSRLANNPYVIYTSIVTSIFIFSYKNG